MTAAPRQARPFPGDVHAMGTESTPLKVTPFTAQEELEWLVVSHELAPRHAAKIRRGGLKVPVELAAGALPKNAVVES